MYIYILEQDIYIIKFFLFVFIPDKLHVLTSFKDIC